MRLMKTAVAVLAICSAGAASLAAAASGQTIRGPEAGVPLTLTLDAIGGSRLGVSVRDVEAGDVKERTLESETGVMLSDVEDGSPAASAGLKAGDVVLEYDGERVRSARQLTRLVRETPAGRRVAVVVWRDGSRMTVTVAPEARPSPPGLSYTTPRGPRATRPPAPPRAPRPPHGFDFELPDMPALEAFGASFVYGFGGARLGVHVQSLSDQLATHFGTDGGVLVASVREDSAAAKAGVRAGDVITKVDGREIDDPGDLTRAIGRASGRIEIDIVRDRRTQTLTATLADQPRRAPAGPPIEVAARS